MLLGSHLAGVAFANAPVAGVHALAYPLGGHFHLPHGLTNALMLAPVLTHNLAGAAGLYADLGAHLGVAGGAEGFIGHVRNLAAATGLPLRLRDHGIDEDALPMLAEAAMGQQRLLVNNPVPIGPRDALTLYRHAW